MSDPLLDILGQGTPATPPAGQRPAAPDTDALLSLVRGAEPAAPAAPARAATPNAPKPSMLDELGHQLGLTARAGVTGLTGLPNMVGDALNSAINLGTRGINNVAGTNIPVLGMPSQATQQIMDRAGVAQPRNGMEQGVQAASSAVAGVNPSVLLGRALAKQSSSVVRAVGDAFQAAPGTQMIGSAAAGGAASAAAQNGAGVLGQIGAGLAGALTGTMAGRLGANIAAAAAKPTQQQLLAQALRDQTNNAVPDVVKPRIKLNVDGTTTDLSAAPNPVPSTLEAPAPAPASGALGSQRQLANIDAMRKIGLNDQRPAAISGDRHQAGIEYEESKLSTPRGEVMRAQLQKEQGALKDFAKQIVADTGAGSAATPEAVGQAIRSPMQALSDHFDTAIGGLYDKAKQVAGTAAPVKPDNLSAALNDKNFRETFLSSPGGTTLLGAIDRQVKRFQGLPVDGEPPAAAPNTVNSAENLRKWLNAQWSPGNSKLIGQVKEALDSDVANAGGAGIFEDARALHGLRKNTLDNPNGISKLLTSDGPNGINQAIPDELVAPKLLAMPTAQFEHVVGTLKSLPEPLQPQGRQALAEIKGALARRIYAAGDSGGTQNGTSNWNASNVTRELNANQSKMRLLFEPHELQKFEDLHNAGHVLLAPTAYKGATAQGFNYLQSGAISAPLVMGTAAGAAAGGTVGATLGSLLGAGASKIVKSGVEAKRAAALAELLRNPSPSFPQ